MLVAPSVGDRVVVGRGAGCAVAVGKSSWEVPLGPGTRESTKYVDNKTGLFFPGHGVGGHGVADCADDVGGHDGDYDDGDDDD
eukprot:8977963-Pyramimonas_sp.AAC.1